MGRNFRTVSNPVASLNARYLVQMSMDVESPLARASITVPPGPDVGRICISAARPWCRTGLAAPAAGIPTTNAAATTMRTILPDIRLTPVPTPERSEYKPRAAGAPGRNRTCDTRFRRCYVKPQPIEPALSPDRTFLGPVACLAGADGHSRFAPECREAARRRLPASGAL